MVFGVETINILAIMQSNTILEVVMNFIALAIISEFDEFIFNALRDEPFKVIIEN